MRKGRKNKAKPTKIARPHRRLKLKFPLGWIKRPSWNVIKRGAVAAAWLLGAAGAVAGWSLGVPKMQAFASQQRAADPNEITIRFANAPPWMKGDLADLLMRTAQANIAGDPLVRDDLVAVRRNLLTTGWFESIDQVRRVDEEIVEITARFVRPHAVVRDGKGDHLIDINATLLPKSYDRGANTYFITITGAHFDRPQRPGMAWEGADIHAAIKLLELIQQQPWHAQVAEIIVSGYVNDEPIKLRTDRGCTIIWGGAPGEEPALETLAQEKLHRLSYLFQSRGRIDADGVRELDITLQDGVFDRQAN